MPAAEDIAQHYSRKAEEFGRDVRACEYRGRGPFLARQKILGEILNSVQKKLILDIGCGTGDFMAPWSRVNVVTGVDISMPMLELARASHHPVAARGEALPFSDATFDMALAIEVLQHVLEPARFIDEMTRVTKPDGQTILMMIHPRSWLQKILRASGLSLQIYQWHAPDEIARLMAQRGWQQCETRFLLLPSALTLHANGPHHALDFLAAAWMMHFRKGTG